MNKLIHYILYIPAALLTLLYYVLLGFWLLIFDPIQRLAYNVFGFNAQQKMVALLNFFLAYNLITLGSRLKFVLPKETLPKGKTYIFLMNHSSLNDVPMVIWHLRHYKVRFVAKKELSKNIPSISYNMQRGGALGIDRKNRQSAMEAMQAFGTKLAETGASIAIFPEGTRTKDGKLQTFKSAGLAALLAGAPNAVVVPIAIKGTYRTGKFPMPLFTKLTWEVLPAIDITHMDAKTIAESAQEAIQNALIK